MADKKSAVISYVDSSNNKGSKTITDLADKIANSKVWAFCNALNSLSTNTISQVDLVEKTDITNAEYKPELELNLHTSNIESIAFGDKKLTSVTYGLDGEQPNLSVEYYFEKSDGSVAHICAATIMFSANWSDSTRNIYVFSETTGCSALQITKLIADLHFAETDSTLATTYRLTVAEGETTTFERI